MTRLLALFALVILPTFAIAQTDQAERDRGFLVGLIEDNLSSVSRQVVVEGFEGALSSQASVALLTIADRDGVWLRAEDLTLDWSRSALLRGAIDIETLSAGSIQLIRPPLADPNLPAAEASPFSLPELPVSIQINSLRADRIVLGEAFLGEEIAVSVEGTVALEGGEGNARITADRVDGGDGRMILDGGYSNATRILSLTLDLGEGADGLVVNALGIPGAPALDLTLAGTGPLDDYTAELHLATDGVERVAGTFGLTTVPGAEGVPAGQDFRVNVSGDLAPLLPPVYTPLVGRNARLVLRGSQGDSGLTLSQLEVETEALTLTGSAQIGADGWPRAVALTGALQGGDGGSVALPGGGGQTRLGSATIDISYDFARGEEWTATVAAREVELTGLRIAALTLSGGGIIAPRSGDTPGRFTAALSYDASGLAAEDPGLAAALGPQISGLVRAERSGDGPVELSEVTLQGPGIDLAANGTVAGSDQRFLTDLSARLAAEDVSRFSGLANRPLGGATRLRIEATARPFDGAFDISALGTTTDLAVGNTALDPLLDGNGTLVLRLDRDETGTRLRDLRVETALLLATGSATLTSGDSRAMLDLSIADLTRSFPGLTGEARIVGNADLKADGTGALIVTATLPGSFATLTAILDDPGSGPQIDLNASGNLADLAPFSGLAERDLTGAIKFSASGIAAQDFGTFDLTVEAETSNLGLGDDRLDPVLIGANALSARAIRTGPQSFRIEALDLAGPLLSARGNVALDGNRITADRLSAAVSDLGPFSRLAGRSLGGAVQADVSGLLVTDASLLDLTADLSASNLRTGDAAIDPLLQGRIELSGGVTRGGPDSYTLSNLDLSSAFVTASGSAEVVDGQLTTDGLSLDIADLGPLSTIARRPLSGAVRAEVQGTARLDGSLFDMMVAARSQDLSLGIDAADALLRGDGRLDGRIARTGPLGGLAEGLAFSTPELGATISGDFTDGAGQGSFDLSLSDAALVAPGLSGGARLTGTVVRRADETVTVAVDGSGAGGLLAEVSATLTQVAGGGLTDWDVETTGRIAANRLDALSALAGRRLGGRLAADVSGTLRTDLSRFDLRLDATGANLDVGVPVVADLLRGEGSFDARVRRNNPGEIVVEGLALRFPNLSVSADIDGDASGAGTARFDARLADLGLFVPEFPGPVTGSGTATLDRSGSWLVDASATGPGGVTVAANGAVRPNGTLDLRATGSAPLGLANRYIEPRRLTGNGTFDLAINGRPSLNAISGTIRASDARLAAPTFSEALQGIDATVTLSGGQATIALTGGLTSGGRLAITGPVALSAPYNGNLTIALEGLILRDPALYETTASGQITMTGPLTGGARIGGTILLGETQIRVPSSSVGGLGTLPDVRHVGADGGVQQTLARAGLTLSGMPVGSNGNGGGGGAIYPLDLTISAPARIFVRGRGLDAELGGTVRIGGTTAQVVPAGQISLIRGRLDILQQRFTLTEGGITLAGDFDPILRLVADTEARSGTNVRITVEGPALSPVVSFTSSPELPQDEVLAQLLFGRDIASITPLQAVQLAAAVSTLAGGGGGVIDRFRESVGLDDLDIATDDQGNAELRVGKYLSENIYTDVTVGTNDTSVSINLDLTDNITARGSVNSEGNTSLGVFFERDY